MKQTRRLILIALLLVAGCDSQSGTTTMAELVQAIASHTKNGDWESVKALSVNPERGSEQHQAACLEPGHGGLRSWTFRESAEVPDVWQKYIPFEGLEACDKVIKMSWSVPVEFGVGNIDVYYPVAEVDGRYHIRFLRIKEEKE